MPEQRRRFFKQVHTNAAIPAAPSTGPDRIGGMSRFLLKIAQQAFSVVELSLCGLGVQFKAGADGVFGLMGQ